MADNKASDSSLIRTVTSYVSDLVIDLIRRRGNHDAEDWDGLKSQKIVACHITKSFSEAQMVACLWDLWKPSDEMVASSKNSQHLGVLPQQTTFQGRDVYGVEWCDTNWSPGNSERTLMRFANSVPSLISDMWKDAKIVTERSKDMVHEPDGKQELVSIVVVPNADCVLLRHIRLAFKKSAPWYAQDSFPFSDPKYIYVYKGAQKGLGLGLSLI